MKLLRGRSILEPRKKIRFHPKPRFAFMKHKKGKKGKTTITANGTISKKEKKQNKILVSCGKPSRAYVKNPSRQIKRELRELSED